MPTVSTGSTRCTPTPTTATCLSSIADDIAALRRLSNAKIETCIRVMERLYENSVFMVESGVKEQTHKIFSLYGPALILAVNDTIDRHCENDFTRTQSLRKFFFHSIHTIMVFFTSSFDRERCICNYQLPESVEAILLKNQGLFDIAMVGLEEATENEDTSVTKGLLHFAILLLMPGLLSPRGREKVISRCLPLLVRDDDSIVLMSVDLFTKTCVLLSHCFEPCTSILLDLFREIKVFLALGIALHMDNDKAIHVACKLLRAFCPEEKVKAIIEYAVEYHFEQCIYSPAA